MDEENLQEQMRRTAEALAKFADQIDDSVDSIKDITDANEKQQRLQDLVSKQLGQLDKNLKGANKKIVDLTPGLEELDEAIEQLDDTIDRSSLETERQRIGNQYFARNQQAVAKAFLKATGEILVNGAIKSVKTLVTDLQDGSSGVRLASNMMGNAIDVTQQQTKAALSAISDLGIAAAVLGKGRFKWLGAGASLLAEGLGFVTDKSAELAKFGIDVLAKEVEKTVKVFNQSSAAGALFANGMTGMRNAAYASGLRLDQFANVIKNNSSVLAETGLSVGEAVRRMGDVGRVIRSSGIQENLLKLGYGYEEQAELVAQVMADMRRTGTLATATNPQIAQATERYANNLRVISDITGEDAKRRTEQARREAENYAFRAKIEEQARRTGQSDLFAQVTQFLAPLPEGQRRAIMQTVLSGTTTDLVSITSGFGEAARASADAIMSGSFNMRQGMDAVSPFFTKFANSTNQLGQGVAFASAMIPGTYSDLSQGYSELQSIAFKMNEEGIKSVYDAVDGQAKTTDRLTDTVIHIENEAQRLGLMFEKELTPKLGSFGKVVDELITGLRKQMQRAGLDVPAGYESGTMGEKSWLKSIAREVVGFASGAALTAGTAAMTGGLGLVGSTVTATGGYMAGTKAFDKMFGEYAVGGIAEGPISGYQATLHGAEAVVPLPENKSIPVSLDSSTITSAITQQTKVLDDILSTMKQSNNISSGILSNTY